VDIACARHKSSSGKAARTASITDFATREMVWLGLSSDWRL